MGSPISRTTSRHGGRRPCQDRGGPTVTCSPVGGQDRCGQGRVASVGHPQAPRCECRRPQRRGEATRGRTRAVPGCSLPEQPGERGHAQAGAGRGKEGRKEGRGCRNGARGGGEQEGNGQQQTPRLITPAQGETHPQVPQRLEGQGCGRGRQRLEGLQARPVPRPPLPAPRGARRSQASCYAPACMAQPDQDPTGTEQDSAARGHPGSLVPGTGVPVAAGPGSASPQPGTGRLACGWSRSPAPG